MKKLLLLVFICSSFIINAQTFTDSIGGAIPDNNTQVCFPITVLGLPTHIDSLYGLLQVCVNVTHTYDGDLKIKLKSPDGTIILLTNNNGGGGDDFTGTCFAANGVNGSINDGSAPFAGIFSPFQSVNMMNNSQDPNGIWYLCAIDEVPGDSGRVHSFSITFGDNPPQDIVPVGPCGIANGLGCLCPDGTSDCDLLPDMTASALIIKQQHTEYPGLLTLSNATPNIGWGPMEIHGSNSCWCDTVNVDCSTTTCPDGSYPRQKLLQTIYHKNGSVITSHDTLTHGDMSYHPSHGHIHVNNWAAFTLRTPTSDPDATTWPIIATGSKISFCLVNLGDCTSDLGYCRDGNDGDTLTKADIPNSGFGVVTGCGVDQGIYVGNLDVYGEGLDGMSIDLTGVCNGDYYIVSITDPDNNFIESNETNNWAATPITLTHQLPAPNAIFTYTLSHSPEIQFFNSVSSLTDSYLWDFGDGGSSTNQNPSHLYTANGIYTVTLIITGSCGTDTTSQTVTVTGVGINESAAAALGYSVYPNPVNESATVSYFLPEQSDVTFELYDVFGKKIYSLSKGNQLGHYEFNFNIKGLDLPNGVYILKLKTETKTAAIRITHLE